MNQRYPFPILALSASIAINIAGVLPAQTVTDGADLNSAITAQSSSINLVPSSANTITTVANTTTGTAGTVTYSSPFPGVIGFSTTINGNGSILSGGSGATPLFIASPSNETATGGVSSPTAYSVTISDLTVSGGVSQGGNGGDGGGAGLGGGLFVGTGATVTLTNVNFTNNTAGGGSSGNNSSAGGGIGAGLSGYGGGGGLFANPPNPYAGGGANGGPAFIADNNGGFGGGGGYYPAGGAGGFGGGGGRGAGSPFGAGDPGGAGGFGGGGGAGGFGSPTGGQGGAGGFGGGGGSSQGNGGINGLGGVGGGDSTNALGGGGAGFGGAIFAQNGSTLILTGNDTLSGDTVTAGTGANNGAAAGSEIFMMTGSSVTLAPGTGNVITIGTSGDTGSDIADDSVASLPTGQSYEPGTAAGAGLTIGSASSTGGTVILNGVNTYAGGTTITNSAILQVASESNLGGGSAGGITLGGGELLTSATTTLSEGVTLTTGANTLAAAQGTTATYAGTFSGTGPLTIGDGTNNGTVNLENSGGFEEIVPTSMTVANGATLGLFGYIDQNNTTISGAGANVSVLKGFSVTTTGNGSDTPLFIYNPNNETASGAVANPTAYAVTVSGLLITNGVSQGGNVSYGGGGAGLGGGAFVGAGATLTLTNVAVSGNIAAGGSTGQFGAGTGGIGGGGIGGNSTGNNGGGLFANDADGGSGGFGGGGAYGGNNGTTGGFGGGAGYGSNGGNGGFGGGGSGRGGPGTSAGFGGVGGGHGSFYEGAYGGGGAGLGGGVFVQNGGAVIVTGNSTISGNTVAGGSGADGGANGSAAGADIFMMMGGAVTLAPGTGNTVAIGTSADDANGMVSDVADDSAYSVQGGSGAGAALAIGNSLTPGGTVVVHGNNTYAGGTTITNGATLEVFQDNNLGAFDSTNLAVGVVTLSGGELLTETDGFGTARGITLDAGTNTLAAATGTDATYSGLITGEALTVGDASNAGTLIVTGANTFSGGTTIGNGGLRLGDGSTPGASLGSGTVTVNGTGIFTLDLANGETFSNQIVDNNQVVLDDNLSSDYTVASSITGTGSVLKSGANTITMTGDNFYSGGTTVNAGTLIAGNVGAFGSGLLQLNAGTVAVANANHGILVGSYAQTGGTLYLTVNGNGQAAVADMLHVANVNTSQVSLGGNLTVNLSNFTKAASGAATYTFPLVVTGAGYTGEFDSFDALDLGPGLTASLDYLTHDVDLQIMQAPNTFALAGLTSNQQAILGPINGALAAGNGGPGITALINALIPLSANPTSLATAVDQLSPQPFGQFASSTAFNNASFATEAKDNYFATRRTGPGGIFTGGSGTIDASGLTLNDPSYDPSLAMVHSRLLAWNAGPLAGSMSDMASPVLGGVEMKDSKEMKSVAAPAYTNPWNFYVQGNVILAQGFSEPGVSHFDDNTESVTLGTDYRITPNFLVGLAAGYGHTDVTLDDNGSSATVDSYSPGFYASYADKGWYANLSGDYIHNAYTQSRVIGFLGQTATSAPEGNEGVANLDGGYDFHQGALTFGPLAGVQYTHLTVDGYNESGSIADLSVNEQNADSLRSRLGGRLSYAFADCGMTFTPHLDASWQHEFLDQSRGITSQFNGGVGSFSVQTTNPSRESALIDLGLDAEINRTVTAFGDYEVQAGQANYFGQSIQGGVKIGF